MRIVDRKTVIHNMGDTRTVQHYDTLLGNKPHKLGLVATLYPELAITTLTNALRNVYYNKPKGNNDFQPINSMSIQWDIDVNFIMKVYITKDVTEVKPGLNKTPFTIMLDRKYYSKNDTFALENKQQLLVIAPPRMVGNNRNWEHTVILVGNDYNKYVDERFLRKGKETRFRSNYFPEMSERGYTKFTSNTETHRNYMSRHRSSDSTSADYAMKEKVYLEVAKKDNLSYYKMHRHIKDCLDTFMEAKNSSMLFSETNYDINGKCLDQDEQGRDLPMGDGIIPQIERYCDKFLYNQLSSAILDDILLAMAEKSSKPKGNIYTVICNERLYNQFGRIMKDDFRFTNPSDKTLFYSKDKGMVQTGADFNSYTLQGNTISFEYGGLAA